MRRELLVRSGEGVVEAVIVGPGCCGACDQFMVSVGIAGWCETWEQCMVCGCDARWLLRGNSAGCCEACVQLVCLSIDCHAVSDRKWWWWVGRWMSENCRGDNDWFASVKDIKTVVVGAGCCAACDQSIVIAGVANWCETCIQCMICGFDAERLLHDESAGC